MYRVIVNLAQPLSICYLLMAIGLAALWRRGSATRGQLLWLGGVLVLLVLASSPPVAYLAMGSLEWSCPLLDSRPDDAQAIVVLSGCVRPADDLRPEPELGGDTLERCMHAAKLYHQGRPCLVVLSGGKGDPSDPDPTPAAAMRDFLLQQGVADADLLTEDRSTTTYENASNAAELLAERGIEKIVLVTSAMHIMRSRQCFTAQGLEVVPAGCTRRATRFHARFYDFLPDADAACDVQEALHEWLGMAWYRLQGRI